MCRCSWRMERRKSPFRLNKKEGRVRSSVSFIRPFSFGSEGKRGELFGDILRGLRLIENVGINLLSSAEAGMAEGKLNVADVGTAVGPEGGCAMAEKVGVNVSADDTLSVPFDEAVKGGGVELMPEFSAVRFVPFGFVSFFFRFYFAIVLMGSEEEVFIGGPCGADAGVQVIPEDGLGGGHEGNVPFLRSLAVSDGDGFFVPMKVGWTEFSEFVRSEAG